MKKNIKTEEALAAWRVIDSAKYTNMLDEDKIKLWKISRVLKPIATKFEEDAKDASDRLQPYENFNDIFHKAQLYESLQKSGKEDLPMSTEEYNNFIEDLKKYNKLVNAAVRELADKEIEIEFEPLTEEAFGKLMSSNDWNMELVMGANLIIN